MLLNTFHRQATESAVPDVIHLAVVCTNIGLSFSLVLLLSPLLLLLLVQVMHHWLENGTALCQAVQQCHRPEQRRQSGLKPAGRGRESGSKKFRFSQANFRKFKIFPEKVSISRQIDDKFRFITGKISE